MKTNIDQINLAKGGINDLLDAQFGANGFRVVDSGSTLAADERYYFLQAVEESVINAKNENGGDDLASFNLLAGVWVVGVFKELTVDSGKILAYIL